MNEDLPAAPKRLIKRYSGDRLYDTETLSYVTAGQLRELWRRGGKFVVKDAASGEDITAAVIGETA